MSLSTKITNSGFNEKNKSNTPLPVFNLACLSDTVVCAKKDNTNYLVAVRESLKGNPDWMHVAELFMKNHHTSSVIFYRDSLTELLHLLRRLQPRYDCVVPKSLPKTHKPRLFFPVGNCLIGDMDNSRESMAAAWIGSGGATAMLADVVPTWYERNGWGALTFWLSSSGRFTLAQAAFLNRQDMLTQEKRRNSQLLSVSANFKTYKDYAVTQIKSELQELMSDAFSKDDVGFIYDRNTVVYYGDPAWKATLLEVPEYDGYEFSVVKNGNRYVVTLKTNHNFSIEKTAGKGFKEEHVGDIPIAYFFSKQNYPPPPVLFRIAIILILFVKTTSPVNL